MDKLTIRQPEFTFPDDLPLTPDQTDKLYSGFLCAVSIVAPQIERYLIRTMSRAKQEIQDPEVLDDLLKFSQQEANHFRSHDELNDLLRSKLSEKNRQKLLKHEASLTEDYRYFSNTRSLNFNLAYAEGFESATCAISVWGFKNDTLNNIHPDWKGIMEWHLAEEIEHRTVAFDVYHTFKGHYLHRLFFSSYAQIHLLKYLYRFALCFWEELEITEKNKSVFRKYFWSLLGHYLATIPPWYSPHKLKVDDRVNLILSKYSTQQ
ncbi:metal-dependent hydrolase [Endozoicomonas arenosclerae]|uniref:metal-dependent hydrolase n=1 Tax=Endozoicomonas arenosclerae TaxID=1633495 RepID=UPI0007849D7F|nr:metal-dependent hydrolase [Endozoicomonas arenosclerae]